MKKITSYFDSCRSACQNIGDDKVDSIFKNHDVASLSGSSAVTIELVQSIVNDICCGSSPQLSTEQAQDVANCLSHNFLKGKPNLTAWKKCFKYWTRKVKEQIWDTGEKIALLVIDVQNDFISGSLALRNCPAKQEGEEVVKVINKLKRDHKFDMVVYSLDWHPEDHCSFVDNVCKYPMHDTSKVKDTEAKLYDSVVYDCEDCPHPQILWPAHCVQNSEGAKLHKDLKVDPSDTQIRKGKRGNVDSYSAFWDNEKHSNTDLFFTLLDNNITTCVVCGLATDFCVSYTSVDAAEHGFETYMVEDATRGVSFDSIESEKKKMVDAGVRIINADQVGDLFHKQIINPLL